MAEPSPKCPASQFSRGTTTQRCLLEGKLSVKGMHGYNT